jgi:hypothetical protein
LTEVGDKVYLLVPKTTFAGVIHSKEQPFYVLARQGEHLWLALTPKGSVSVEAEISEVTSKKPPITVYDFILEDDE